MTHKEKQVEQDILKAISKFSQSFMSNSKWVRLVEELIKNIDKIKKIQVKKNTMVKLACKNCKKCVLKI